MLTKKSADIKSSEITDQKAYLNRRLFVRGALLAGSVTATGLLYRKLNPPPAIVEERPKIAGLVKPPTDEAIPGGFKVNEPLTSFEDITNYNNFYEFSTEKRSVAEEARGFVTRPWAVEVGGLVGKPKVFDLDDLLTLAPQEERIYRHRCVEGWSMVIPWAGFPLAALLSRVEGLRLDEAMNPLAILATGMYGQTMPPQDGAPVRLVVPWKYGFKSIKSIVKIMLAAEMPPTTWNIQSPNEYGFYSNVNPNVDHPRWSQRMEHRIGEFGSRPTLLFNGYAEQVGHLYEGMDLRVNY
jgi:sulfoxide reductase catalytic subunit YedY